MNSSITWYSRSLAWGAIQPVLKAATAAVSRASSRALPITKRWLKPTACITVISLSAYKRP
ncbi:hypothetical protein D3C85_1540030 [compost metagenome]